MTNFWVGVASQDHVQLGVQGGFCQLCHGRLGAVRRLAPGDGIVYYSPRMHISGGLPFKAFTAIGRIKDRPHYQVDMGGGFMPYRRDVQFSEGFRSVEIAPLLTQLNFSKDRLRSWGQLLRRGVFQIDSSDFTLIAEAMGVSTV